MAVYLLTTHAYRWWDEDHPKGYVQRDAGLQEPSAGMAQWREDHASHEPARFDSEMQEVLLDIVELIATERGIRPHGASATRTHVHKLISFRSPACMCGVLKICKRDCPAKAFTEKVLTRMKQKMGQAAAKLKNTSGRPWFSRGWDITPVRGREHFDHLRETYLPKHAIREGGVVRIYE